MPLVSIIAIGAALELAARRAKDYQAMASLAKLRRNLLTDPEGQAEYDRLFPIFAVVGKMIKARQAAGLTEKENATRVGTFQSVVVRLENARHMPRFEMIARYAAAIGRRLDIHLVPSSA